MWANDGFGAPPTSGTNPIWTTNQEPIHRPPTDPWKALNKPHKPKKKVKMGPDGPILDINTDTHPGQDLCTAPKQPFPFTMSMLDFPTSPFAALPIAQNPDLDKLVIADPEKAKCPHDLQNQAHPFPDDTEGPPNPPPSRLGHGFDRPLPSSVLGGDKFHYLESEVERRRREMKEGKHRMIEKNHNFVNDPLINRTHPGRGMPGTDQLKSDIMMNVPIEPARHPGMDQV